MMHPAQLDPEQLVQQCDMRRVRRSGPGGQRRNKVETGVVLTHRPTGISAEASECRSPAENRLAALRRLRLNLALAVRSAGEQTQVPSHLWLSRQRGGRIAVNPQHDDFPALLAEALDALARHQFGLAPAAARLGCTPTQLLKLVKLEPRALRLVNAARASRRLHALK